MPHARQVDLLKNDIDTDAVGDFALHFTGVTPQKVGDSFRDGIANYTIKKTDDVPPRLVKRELLCQRLSNYLLDVLLDFFLAVFSGLKLNFAIIVK